MQTRGSEAGTSGELVDSAPLLGHPRALRERFEADGALLLRRLCDPAAVAAVRLGILEAIGAAGWLAEKAPSMKARPGPHPRREGDAEWWEGYARIQAVEEFHALPRRDDVLAPVRALLGPHSFVHPRTIARVTYPRRPHPTPAHQDYLHVQGAVDTLTVWLPLGACTVAMGALQVVPGSHHRGLRPAVAAVGVGGLGVEVTADEESAWLTTDFEPGDAVLFHSLTVHRAPSNRSGRLRLSMDMRYQRTDEPVCAPALLPHGHPDIPGWEVLTRGWASPARLTPPDRVDAVPLRDARTLADPPPSRFARTPVPTPS